MSSKLDTGYLVKVELKDGRTYRGIVIENYPSRSEMYEGCFLSRVLDESDKVGKATSNRYGLQGRECRFEQMKDVNKVEILSKPNTIVEEGVNFYRTSVDNTTYTFCLNEGFGGWSTNEDKVTALCESAKVALYDGEKYKSLSEAIRRG